jgi:hypothetical protein
MLMIPWATTELGEKDDCIKNNVHGKCNGKNPEGGGGPQMVRPLDKCV